MSAVFAMADDRNEQAQVAALLREWVTYRHGWNPHIGNRSAVPWIDQVNGTIDSYAEGDDYDQRLRAIRMRHVDEAIKNLSVPHQHAIGVVYLNEIGPAVWRSARKPMAEIRALCLEAERLLIVPLRRRNVL